VTLDKDNAEQWEKKEAFKKIVESLVVTTKNTSLGVVKQCPHCKLIRKKRKDLRVKGKHGNEFLECGCTKNKGVCEKLLLDRGILGTDVENEELQSLSDKEWFKLDHVMAALFGYNTSWLMNKEVMIAGLEAKLAELKT